MLLIDCNTKSMEKIHNGKVLLAEKNREKESARQGNKEKLQ